MLENDVGRVARFQRHLRHVLDVRHPIRNERVPQRVVFPLDPGLFRRVPLELEQIRQRLRPHRALQLLVFRKMLARTAALLDGPPPEGLEPRCQRRHNRHQPPRPGLRLPRLHLDELVGQVDLAPIQPLDLRRPQAREGPEHQHRIRAVRQQQLELLRCENLNLEILLGG